jgi:hypothetical protein
MLKGSVLVFLAMVIPVAGLCKCSGLAIRLKGRVNGGEVGELRIVAETTPDANWKPQPEIVVQHGAFAGEVYFDSFKSREFNDICTRVPESVEVKLLRGKHLVDSVRLDVSKDFVRDEHGDYNLRVPVEFHLR